MCTQASRTDNARALPVVQWRRGTLPEDISSALFDGALIVFRGVDPLQRLIRRARLLVEEVFESSDPENDAPRVTPALFRQTAIRARKAVEQDADADRYWRECLAVAGYDPDACHLDRIRLRVVPSASETHGRVIRPLPAHRDTWGSGILAQINWWLPLYPLVPGRTMVMWPELFRRPMANDSAEWDYEALIQGGRRDYPLLPVATEALGESGTPVLIEPGELLAFSAAHLHASTTDASGLCRISIDTRTVWAGDLTAGRGASNVDGRMRREQWEWFTRPKSVSGT